MHAMLNPSYYTRRIVAARDPLTFTKELVRYTGFLSSRVGFMTQMFREGLIERDINKLQKSATPIIFQ